MANPLTKAEQDQIRTLCDEGVSRNEIARRLDRPRSTITSFCSRAGIRFEGTIPAAMAQAAAINVKERQVAARERRLKILELEDERQLAVLEGRGTWTTRVKTQGGGERWDVVEFIPADDAQRNATSAAAHTSAFKNLAPMETGGDTAAAESVIDKLMAGFVTAARTAPKTESTGDEEAASE